MKDHASPNELWQLCVTDSEQSWSASLSLGAIVKNIMLRQLPKRTLKAYFKAWMSYTMQLMARRRAAAMVLRRMEDLRFNAYVHMLFRWGSAGALRQ